jgi:hypothetical protein
MNVLRRSMWVTCFHDYRATKIVKEVTAVAVFEARLELDLQDCCLNFVQWSRV